MGSSHWDPPHFHPLLEDDDYDGGGGCGDMFIINYDISIVTSVRDEFKYQNG